MPIIDVTLARGRSPEQLNDLIGALSQAAHDAIGAPLESVRVILREVEPTHFAAGGVTLAARAARQETAPPRTGAKS